jgi:uncharacterized protein
MTNVVLDANALLLPFERSINLDAQLQGLVGTCVVYVPGPIIGELKHSVNKNAVAALKLAGKYHIEHTTTTGDQAVIELATRHSAYVVTNDRILIGKLRTLRIKVILLRGGSHLDFEMGY